jgi:mannosyltransferase OCH1-like enzyme
MIPRILHTVWVGDKKIPDRESEFIENNRKILSNYEFFLWGNDNINELVSGYELEPLVRYAIENKRYAHASDVIKTIALKKFGGWSIDADNKILKDLEPFRQHTWVSGFELYGKSSLNPITSVWGALPSHKFTKRIIKYYLDTRHDEATRVTNTSFISKILLGEGKIIKENRLQYSQIFDVTLYPSWTFCTPKNGNESYSLHAFSASWKNRK